MIDAMAGIGERFKNGEIFVPEMLIAAKAMKKIVEECGLTMDGIYTKH